MGQPLRLAESQQQGQDLAGSVCSLGQGARHLQPLLDMVDCFEDGQASSRALARPQPERDRLLRSLGDSIVSGNKLGLALGNFREASLQGFGDRPWYWRRRLNSSD